MTKAEAKIAGVRALQDANMALCDASFTLEGHASPAFEREVSAIQERVRDAIGAVERLQ